MEFGLFMEWPNAGARRWGDAFAEGVAQAQLAEQLGFTFCLIAEHHFSDYGIAPAPVLESLAILQETSTLRVGPGVAVLPTWDPLRLAEEIAVADQISGGRFIAGVGRGFVPFEQERFGGDLERSRAHFGEALEVLLKAWTETDFTHEGRFVNVPLPTTVLPRPFQQPHPPLWLAGASDDSVELVGRLGATPILSASLGAERIAEYRAAFLASRARHGHDQHLALVAQAHCFVGSEGDLADVAAYARWQRRAVPALLAQQVAGGVLSVTPIPEEPDDASLIGAQLIGTPEDVTNRIRTLEAAGVTHLSLLVTFGGLEHDRVLRSLRRFGEEIVQPMASEQVRSRTPHGL